MKNIKFLFVLFVSSLYLSACGGDSKDEPAVPAAPASQTTVAKIDIAATENTSPSFESNGGALTLSFTSSQSWTVSISGNPDWLSVTPTSGNAGNATLTITTKANETSDSRTATVTITCGTATKTISVSQKKSENVVPVTNVALVADAAVIHGTGGTTKVTIKSKNDWKAKVEKGDPWLKINTTSGKNGDQIEITTQENTGKSDREGSILIEDGTEAQRITVTQYQNVIQRKAVVNNKKARMSVMVNYDSGITINKVMAVMPYQVSNAYQDVSNMKTSDIQVQTSTDGITQYGYLLKTEGFPASGGELAYTEMAVTLYDVDVNFDAITTELPYDKDSQVFKQNMGDSKNGNGDKLIDTSDSRIKSIGDKLWGQANGKIVEYARLCYEHVASEYKYLNPNTGLHPISKLLDDGGGDCGNLSDIFISLLRYKEIPARNIVMVGPADGTHVRAEFYLAGYGWIPVDVTFHMDFGGDYFGHFTNGQYIIQDQQINIPVKLENDSFICEILQLPYYWYWYDGSGSVSISYNSKWVD